ncbi:MAG: hypothetical protein IPM54_04965 [Polyangiaceae bacterium]|nr:hypothetical protein [Polyangiaceae bacterium]
MANRWCSNLFVRSVVLSAVIVGPSASPAWGQDLSSIVAKAREQTENGAFADALRTLSTLPKSDLPPTLAVEAGLLEATAALVTKGEAGGQQACAKAVVAAGYDPEVARDQSPKVRAVCRAAAERVRKERIDKAGVKLGDISVAAPEVAWQPVRLSADVEKAPTWLRVVARVRSSALEGSFDLPLAPSPEGPLRGTLDPSFIRPGATLEISLVAQDKFGDLLVTSGKQTVAVPKREALVSFGDVPSAARVFVDDKPVEPDDSGRVAVEPGKHEVSMEVGEASASTKVEVERGSIARVALSPQKGGGRTLAWIATGSAVVLGSVGGVLLGTAASRKAEIEDLAKNRELGTSLPATSYADIKARDDERRLFSNVGAGLAIGGGVVGALAITLWLLPSGRSSAPAKKEAHVWTTIEPQIGLGTVGLSGRF